MTMERTVYVLDDDAAVLRSLERLLSSANFEPVTFERPDLFLAAAKTFKTGCVLLDIRLPGTSGLDVQTQLRKVRNDLAVIVMTAQGDVQTAVRAMKAGASDFLDLGRSRRRSREKPIWIPPMPSGVSPRSVRANGTFLTDC